VRAARPDIALSGDFIVGFPGETEADFARTLQLIDTVGYAQAFSFKYSPRPGTPAATMDRQVPLAVMDERLQRLQDALNRDQLAFNKASVGKRCTCWSSARASCRSRCWASRPGCNRRSSPATRQSANCSKSSSPPADQFGLGGRAGLLGSLAARRAEHFSRRCAATVPCTPTGRAYSSTHEAVPASHERSAWPESPDRADFDLAQLVPKRPAAPGSRSSSTSHSAGSPVRPVRRQSRPVENRLGVYIAPAATASRSKARRSRCPRPRRAEGHVPAARPGPRARRGAVESLIVMSSEPTLEGIITAAIDAPPIMIRTRKKTIVPRSRHADRLHEGAGIEGHDLRARAGGHRQDLSRGGQAVQQLITGSVQRLILSRPAVEAGERLGFLPAT
jgi:hypothetical protein